jgi:membrane-bound lytic murein transglycosylase D
LTKNAVLRVSSLLFLGVGVISALGSGCAHSRSGRSSYEDAATRAANKNVNDFLRDERQSRGEPIEIHGVKLQNSNFDIPIVVNSRVEYWVDYFLGKGRVHFERYLERSELFIPYITPLLKQNGLPEDLVYLAMIESGFNNHARSRAKAVGPWQFISATGKRYGLMVNWWVDERRDTRKSTLAAVEYLRDLYAMFDSWELAAAAYNAGEAKIGRAVRRFGTKDFWTITRQRFLRPETRDYVPKIIAAAILAKNRTQFGFPASTVKPGEGEVLAGDGSVVRLEPESENNQPTPMPGVTNSQEALMRVLSEESEEDYESSPTDIVQAGLSVPAVTRTASDDEAGPAPLAKPIPTPHVNKKGVISGEELLEFELRSPADLLKVARAAGLSYHTVKSLNPEIQRWCTPPIMSTYRIKLPASTKDRFLTTYNHSAYPRKVNFQVYKVRSGDTLARIARHFGIKVDPIADLNRISPKAPLRPGSQVLLPMPNDRSRSLASLEVRDPPEKRRIRRGRKRQHKSYRISYKRREAARSAVSRTPQSVDGG